MTPATKIRFVKNRIEDKISISPKGPVVEILNRENDKEIEDRTKVYEAQHKAVAETQKELDNLTKMRYRELIDDATFVKERDLLSDKLTKLKHNLHQTEDRAEKWLELTEKMFNFACYARENYGAGTLDKKREIFSALGWNFWIKDKIVRIQANEWFVPIEKAYPELEAEYRRLELEKYLTVEARNAAFASLILRWGAVVEDVRTTFERINDGTIYIPTFSVTEFTNNTSGVLSV